MSSIHERKQALIEHKVITDVLPGELELSYDLTLKWPNTTLDKAGPDLDFEDTQPEPKVYINPPVCITTFVHGIFKKLPLIYIQPSGSLNNLVLIMTDPVSSEKRFLL